MMHLNRSMQRLLRKHISDVAEKDRSTGFDDPDRTFQNLQQIIDVRKVLDDRVQDYSVEGFVLVVSKVFGRALEQLHLVQVVCGANLLDDVARLARSRWPNNPDNGSNAREQQAGTATDFEHALWFETEKCASPSAPPIGASRSRNRRSRGYCSSACQG